jgi:hypothetical protein
MGEWTGTSDDARRPGRYRSAWFGFSPWYFKGMG